MAATATLTGYPEIKRLRFTQPSAAEPGRCAVVLLDPASVATLPRVTTLSIAATDFSGTWPEMRMVKAPEVRGGFMKVLLEDSRWKMREVKLGTNYNERTASGAIRTATEQTVDQLVATLATAAGITIEVGSTPSFNPPARWAGLSVMEAMRDLIHNTGCRLVYKPTSQSYQFVQAGSGALPDLSNRLYAQNAPSPFQTLKVRSAPIHYEQRFDCTAKQINPDTGELEALNPTTLPTSPTDNLTRYRVWEPTTPGEAKLLDHRPKSEFSDPGCPTYERGRVIVDDWEPYPYHQPTCLADPEITNQISLTGNGRAFMTKHPVLASTNTGTLVTDVKVLTGHYDRADATSDYNREEKEISIGGTADTFVLDLDWIKPIESQETDIPTPVWDTLLTDAANAISNFFKHPVQHVTLPEPVDVAGSGQVGEVTYFLTPSTNRAVNVRFSIAVNFAPGERGLPR